MVDVGIGGQPHGAGIVELSAIGQSHVVLVGVLGLQVGAAVVEEIRLVEGWSTEDVLVGSPEIEVFVGQQAIGERNRR